MSFPTTLPVSRVPDPMTAPPLRWGLLGTGWIAQRFIESARAYTRQEIAAVGSRSRESAERFAAEWQIATVHGSYEALVQDRSLDVIYVATPHNLHAAHVEMALRAGKHVLVEKPMVLSHADGVRLVALARAQGVFLAEALWTYFLPKFDVLDQVLASGALGEIKSVHTEYGEHFARNHRIFDPSLAGGPLNDLGTYPVSLLTRLLGVPKVVLGLAQMDASGVQGQLSVILADAIGNQGTLSTTLYGFTPTNAAIVGTGGTVRFGSEFNLPGPFQVISADGSRVLDYVEPPGRHFEGLCYEAAEVARCISQGLTETPKRPFADTLAMLATMDAIRAALETPG